MSKKPLHVRVALVVDDLHIVAVPAKSLPFSFAPNGPPSFPRQDSYLLMTKDEVPVYFDGGHPNDIYVCADGRNLPLVPRYDLEWEHGGPLVEEYGIGLDFEPVEERKYRWRARREGESIFGPTPLIAVCNLILALKAAGKLLPAVEEKEPS
jgi:hypothetical protein